MANENDVVRLKHLNSLASVVHDITLHSGGDSQAVPPTADFALYVPNDTSIIITGKQAPVLSLGSWSSADTVYSAPITYTGDGTLSTDIGTIANDILTVADEDGTFNGVISASAGDDFSSTELIFNYNTETNIVDVLSDPLEFVLSGTSFALNEDNVFGFGRDTITRNNNELYINGDADARYFYLNQATVNDFKLYKISENTGLTYSKGNRGCMLHALNITPDGKFTQHTVSANSNQGEIVLTNGNSIPDYFPALCNDQAVFSRGGSDTYSWFNTVTISSSTTSLTTRLSQEYANETAKYKINNTYPNSAELLKGKPPVISYNGEDVTLAEGTKEVKQPIVRLVYANNAETALTYSGLPKDSVAVYTIASANRTTVNTWLTDDQNVLLGCFYNKAKSSTYIITYKPGTYSKNTYLDDAFTVWGFMFDQSTHNTATLIKSPKKLPEILDDIAI